MKEIHIKGLAFVGVLRAIESLRGKPFRDQAVAELAGEGGEALRLGTVLATGWYPCSWYRGLLGAAERLDGRSSFVREVGRVSTRDSVSVVHRIFMRMLSPDTLIKQGARVFTSFYEAKLAVEPKGKGVARVLWSDCHGFDKNCWLDQLGATDELVALSGAKLPRVRLLEGGSALDTSMVAEVTWRA